MTTKVPNSMLEAFELAASDAGLSVSGVCNTDGDDYFELFALYSVASGNATFTEVRRSMRFEGFAI